MTPDDGRRLRQFVELHSVTEPGWVMELAERVGVSKSALMAWFAGSREPSLDSLRALGVVLGVPRWAVLRAMDGE